MYILFYFPSMSKYCEAVIGEQYINIFYASCHLHGQKQEEQYSHNRKLIKYVVLIIGFLFSSNYYYKCDSIKNGQMRCTDRRNDYLTNNIFTQIEEIKIIRYRFNLSTYFLSYILKFFHISFKFNEMIHHHCLIRVLSLINHECIADPNFMISYFINIIHLY